MGVPFRDTHLGAHMRACSLRLMLLLGVSLFRNHRLPLTTPLAWRWSLVAFQPPPDLAGGLVLVPTQGPFVSRGGSRLLTRPIRVQTRYARQAATGSGEAFGGGGV